MSLKSYKRQIATVIDSSCNQMQILQDGTLNIFPTDYAPNFPLHLDPANPWHLPKILHACGCLESDDVNRLPPAIIALLVASRLAV